MNPRIRALTWDDAADEHISRHGVTLDEVDQATRNPAYARRESGLFIAPWANRWWKILIGGVGPRRRGGLVRGHSAANEPSGAAFGGPSKATKEAEVKEPTIRQRRKEAAEYWSTHPITEGEREEVVIDVDAKKPLSVVLSIRLDDEHLARLKGLAKQQDVGVTTLARRLLRDSLVERERPPMPNADRLSSIVGRIGEAKGRDYGDGENTYYVLSRAQLRRIEERLADASRKTLADAIEGSALAYGADMDDLLEAIRQIEM